MNDADYDRPFDPTEWRVERDGRSWGAQAMERFMRAPEKFEMSEGKLFWDDTQRLTVLAMLLENMGADAAVRIGDPVVWRAAIADLD